MKCLFTILAFYFLVIASLPCSDVASHCNERVSKVETSVVHVHNQDANDECSPLCCCGCCRVHVSPFQFVYLSFDPLFIVFPCEKIEGKGYDFVSLYTGSIWHPPKHFV